MNKLSIRVIAALAASVPFVSAVAANDPDSIGRSVKYLDYAAGKPVMLTTAAASPTPCDSSLFRCFMLNDQGTGTADVPDLTTVDIGANASRSLICSSIQFNAGYVFRNALTDSTFRRSTFLARPTFKLESAALNDLSLINPLTGVPFNGSIVRIMSTFMDESVLPAGQIEQHFQNWSSECTKGFVSRSMLMKDYGLSATAANRVITQPMKITIGVSINNSFMHWSNFNIAVRLYSD